jgi:SAM-dependent methyltransferase
MSRMPINISRRKSVKQALRLLNTGMVICVALLLGACNNTEEKSGEVYTTGPASQGGTGRYYMGRELAHFMSYEGAGWLERPERETEERTDLVVQSLPLEPESVVADIGAGSGFFTRRIARRIPAGTVIAVDIQPEMLAILRDKAAAEGIENIETVLATEQSLNLEPNSIDLALFVDVYHELMQPLEVMRELRTALKPGGKVILIEYRAEDPSIPIIPVHKMTARQASLEMEAAGFQFVENLDVLPTQHFLVFSRDIVKPQ